MDCRTARLFLSFVRPLVPELETADLEALDKHLADCLECGSLARAEHQADRQMGLAMRGVSVPADLRGRLLRRLRSERHAWYRGWPIRHPRISVAAAALAMAVVGLAFYLSIKSAPAIDVLAIREQAIEQHGASSEVVQKWFRDKYGIQTLAPPNFDYAHLDSFDLNGDRLPQLVFIRGNYRAYVRIVSAGQSDINALLAQSCAESGGHAVEVQAHPTDPTIVYLIEYTGPSLASFLVAGEQAT